MPKISNTAMRWMLSLVSALLIVTSASAQDPGDSADLQSFNEIVDVRVINLEVVVTDGKERVEGLSNDDFRLLVDGQEVPIEFFTEVSGGRATPAAESGASRAEAVPALRPGEAVGTRYLVFIDETFAIPADRNRVLRDLAEQLPLLGPEDHMAVVAFDGRQIDLLSSWTRSIPELERVFETARERKAFGLYNDFTRLGDLRYEDPFGHFSRFSRLEYSALDRYPGTPRGSRTAMLVDRVVDAASSVLRGFAKPPGRKVMLLLSGGWPAADWDGFSSAVNYGAWGPDRQVYRPLIDMANRLGYTLYPVDMKGLETAFGSAQYGSLAEAQFAENVHRDREWVEEGALVFLARETGGQAHLDGAGARALERTIRDTRSYYWLGFSPAWREDDRRHQVKIEVKPKGLKVRTRRSFSDLSRQTEVTMLVESAQLFDLPIPGERSGLEVSFGEPRDEGFRKVVVPMRVTIPYDQITLLPAKDGFVAQLELRVAVTDEKGDRAYIPVIPVQLEQGASPQAGEAAVYEIGLKLRRRDHKLLVSLHDAASGTILSQRVDLSL